MRINNYTLWVEEAALIQGMGELHITWRAASPRFWEMPDGEFSQAWTAVDDQGTAYTSIWDRAWDGERMLPYVGSVQFTGALVWSGEQTVYGVPQEAQWIQINIETGEGTIPVVLVAETAYAKARPEVAARFLAVYRRHRVRFVWVKGHADNPMNNRCDQLAVAAATAVIKASGGKTPEPPPASAG